MESIDNYEAWLELCNEGIKAATVTVTLQCRSSKDAVLKDVTTHRGAKRVPHLIDRHMGIGLNSL